MRKNPILRKYVSELDRFLLEFDEKHPTLSLTQQTEVTKHQRVYQLRDNADKTARNTSATSKLWDKF